MMPNSAEDAGKPEKEASKRPHIGAFVLETLTLGMYGEPKHTLREYVQNSFDSIRAAHRRRLLVGRGRVDITLEADCIIIKDNGLGVPSEQAWATLTSIGASKKDRQRDAGFRGIGRLAGMAYCDTLTFKTTFPGETTLTKVVFDCTKLLAGMNPDHGGELELAKLLQASISFDQEEGVEEEEHFFEVSLSGLVNAPKALTDFTQVLDYLSENAPVEFAPEWKHRERIALGYQNYFGEPIETVDVFLTGDSKTFEINKPYGEFYAMAKSTAELLSIEEVSSENSFYWGWIGHLSESGAVTDSRTRGLRVRLRNIQVDRTDILEKVFSDVNRSYGRFNFYYVGEIHINPESVIPNARRDGFEETGEWLKIQKHLRDTVCFRLASEAYDASKSRQSDVEKVLDDIKKLEERSQSLVESSRATYDQVVDLMNSAKRLRKKAASKLRTFGDLEDIDPEFGPPRVSELKDATKGVEDIETQARQLMGQILDGEDDRIAGLKERLRHEIISELLDIVSAYVDPVTYQKIRRSLSME